MTLMVVPANSGLSGSPGRKDAALRDSHQWLLSPQVSSPILCLPGFALPVDRLEAELISSLERVNCR